MSYSYLNPTMEKLLKSFKLDVSYVKGQGSYLHDEKGNKYLDFIAQYGAVPFGYNSPEINNTAREFLDSGFPAMVQPSVPPKAVELAELLIELAPGNMKQATFCQSGAEAVEIAIKLARSSTGKKKIISTRNSFHGKTMGALSATGREVYQKPFNTPVDGFEHITFNDLKALEQVLEQDSKNIAAFLVEPIQGEGGIIIPSQGYLKKAELLCRKYEVLFILDEIQTGLGRTGTLFACEKESVEPDILLLAKALGGGLVPVGVCLSSKDAWNPKFGSLHSSTFANNNFTCSIGLAVLKKLIAEDKKLLKEVNSTGTYLRRGLEDIGLNYPGVIKEARGSGLMVGLEFNEFDGSESFSIKYMAQQGGFSPLVSGYLLHIQGVRCAPFLNNPMTLRLQPSLNVSKTEVDRALEAIERVVQILYYQDYSELYSYLFNWESAGVIKDFRQFKKPIISSEVGEANVVKDKNDTRKDDNVTKEKFAFLIHYPSEEDSVKNNPSFGKLKPSEREELLDWEASLETPPDKIIHMPAIKSKTGSVAEGWLIGVPYSGRHLVEMPRSEAVSVLAQAVDLARDLGAKIVGLGAYTSVVSRGGSDLQNRGVAITSGNSYTVATAFEALLKGAKMMDLNPEKCTGAVIGATGAIGRVCALMLSEEVEQLYLVGNPAKEKTSLRRLERLADEIYEAAFRKLIPNTNNDRNDKVSTSQPIVEPKGIAKWVKNFLDQLEEKESGIILSIKNEVENNNEFSFSKFIANNLDKKGRTISLPLRVTVNIQQALMRSELIISASNSTSELIGPGYLKPGSVICDVARPADVSRTVMDSRKDVLVIEGGLVKYPDPICFGQNMGYAPGVNLACLSETILLALEGHYKDFSIGLKLSMEDIHYIRTLAKKHGFKLAMPRNDKGEITGKIARATKKEAFLKVNAEEA